MTRFTRLVSKALAIVVGLQSAWLGLVITAPTVHAAGTADQLANHLVISEVLVGIGDNNDNEFVELYNPTKQAINISDAGLWVKLAIRDAAGTTVTLPIDYVEGRTTTIQPGGYYLIANDNGSYSASADARYSDDLGRLEDNNSVALVTDTATIDLLGWGFQALGGGDLKSYTTNPDYGSSLQRKPGMSEGNGVDTDDSNNDFTVSATLTPKSTVTGTEFGIAPTISNITPTFGGYLNTKSVTVTATVTDSGSGVNPNALTLAIDGTQASTGTYDNTTKKVTFPAVTLTEGARTVTITAQDLAGFVATQTGVLTIDATAPTVSATVKETVVTQSAAVAALKLSYADMPSASASGVSAMRIAFDGTLDTEAWVPSNEVAAGNLPTREGSHTILVQVMDRAGNVSAVAQTTAAIKAGTMPAPDYAISSTTGNTITVTWPAVSEATSYLVRYNDGQTLYGPITTTNPFITISSLDTSKKYSFEIASVSRFGTVSAFTKVYPPELSPAPAVKAALAAATTTVSDAVAETTTVATEETTPRYTQQSQPTATPTITPTPSPTASPDGEIKGGAETRQPDWTKVIVALSILIIAAGVATGGWYLYQWWTSQPKEKGKGKGGRW
jgi:hypothetical protein